MIRLDPRNRRAVERARELEPLLEGVPLPDDLCLVLGGDGHMLHVIHELGPAYRYLGVNCGRVGFLLNDVPSLQDLVAQLEAQGWSEREVHRLALHGVPVQGPIATDIALNDIYLERASGQAAHLRITVDGCQVVDRMVCDGVVINTALGSTAYSMAAGGPACHMSVPMLGLTPIAPHRPRLPSLVLPADSVVEVDVLDGDKRPVRAVVDGRDHPPMRRVTIRDAESSARLCFLEGHHPTNALVRKLLGG